MRELDRLREKMNSGIQPTWREAYALLDFVGAILSIKMDRPSDDAIDAMEPVAAACVRLVAALSGEAGEDD